MAFGAILVIMMTFRPEGLLPSRRVAAEQRGIGVAGGEEDGCRDSRGRNVSLLSVRAVTKRFEGLVAVSEVDLTVEEGQIRSIIGPNGAGKTTLFNCITGIYEPDERRDRVYRHEYRQLEATHDHAKWHRAHVSEHQALRQHDGARKRDRWARRAPHSGCVAIADPRTFAASGRTGSGRPGSRAT